MEQRSIQTRARIVRAAHALFCERGIRQATMEEIAAAAGVAVQTVYFQYRTKNELLRAVHEWTVMGDEGLPPQLQEWSIAALAQVDARDAVAAMVAGVVTLNERIAPTLPIFAALAREPAGEIYRNSRRLRREGMEYLVKALIAKAPLRPGLLPAQAADIVDFLMGPEAYAELVLNTGWSRRRWVEWTSRLLSDQLFGPA